jgi:hypothetical protein
LENLEQARESPVSYTVVAVANRNSSKTRQSAALTIPRFNYWML